MEIKSEVGIYKRQQEIEGEKEKKQENNKEKKKVFRLKNINQFYFQPLKVVSVICRFDQIEDI